MESEITARKSSVGAAEKPVKIDNRRECNTDPVFWLLHAIESVFNIPSSGSEELFHLYNAVQKWVGRRFKFRASRTNGIVR